METIERILGHEISIPPEPFIPEGELRPLTEADYQRLFEEFCATPVFMPPPEFWTETTTITTETTPAPEESSATAVQRIRHHRPPCQGNNQFCQYLFQMKSVSLHT